MFFQIVFDRGVTGKTGCFFLTTKQFFLKKRKTSKIFYFKKKHNTSIEQKNTYPNFTNISNAHLQKFLVFIRRAYICGIQNYKKSILNLSGSRKIALKV